MRIGFVCYEMFHPGGIRVYGHELLNHLAGMGHDIVLFSPPPGPDRSTRLDPRVTLRQIPVSPIPLTSAFSFWIQLPGAVLREGTKRKFDVIHSNCADDVLLSRRAALRARRVVTVHHLGASVLQTARIGHFNLLRGTTKEYGPAMVAEALSIQRADHIIAVSRFTRTEILRHHPTLEPARITTVYNGVRQRPPNTDVRNQEALRKTWGVEPDTKIMLFVGRLEERKGLRFLYHALARLPDTLGVRLLVAGSGNASPYRKLARKLGIQGKVELLGYIDDPELSVAYSVADLLVQPSVMEGFGFAAADAITQGIPVVATRVGAVPELVLDNVDGILVEYGDVGGLSRAIVRALSASEKGHHQTRRDFGTTMHWEKTARETLAVYEHVVRQNAGP